MSHKGNSWYLYQNYGQVLLTTLLTQPATADVPDLLLWEIQNVNCHTHHNIKRSIKKLGGMQYAAQQNLSSDLIVVFIYGFGYPMIIQSFWMKVALQDCQLPLYGVLS